LMNEKKVVTAKNGRKLEYRLSWLSSKDYCLKQGLICYNFTNEIKGDCYMYHLDTKGFIEVVCGPMFAGKT
jgi:hypothetical protein